MNGATTGFLCRVARWHVWSPCECKGGWQWAHVRRVCGRCGRHEHLSYGSERPSPSAAAQGWHTTSEGDAS